MDNEYACSCAYRGWIREAAKVSRSTNTSLFLPIYKKHLSTSLQGVDMAREVGSGRFTRVMCLDEPGPGGACHKYRVEDVRRPSRFFAGIVFQQGPILESDINGCTNEDLLAVVLDRLECFQKGDFACTENVIALTKIKEAIYWLESRTKERQERGVEGKSVV